LLQAVAAMDAAARAVLNLFARVTVHSGAVAKTNVVAGADRARGSGGLVGTERGARARRGVC